MELLNSLIALVGHIAWPCVTLILGIKLFSELEKGGFLAKLMPPGGSIEYAGAKFTLARVEETQRLIADAGVTIETPSYVDPVARTEEKDDQYSPYDLVMRAWGDLAEVVTALGAKHGGYDDQRQVWSNVDQLKKRGVIDERLQEAVRALQIQRNSIRRTQDISVEAAKVFAKSAYSLQKRIEQLTR